MAEEKIAFFSPNAGSLEIELVVGQIKRANFEINLFDKAKKNIQQEGGNVENNDPTEFPLNGTLQDLNGGLLAWNAIIKGSKKQKGQKWAVTMFIRQNGSLIENGAVENDGVFSTVAIVMDDKVRLKAK